MLSVPVFLLFAIFLVMEVSLSSLWMSIDYSEFRSSLICFILFHRVQCCFPKSNFHCSVNLVYLVKKETMKSMFVKRSSCFISKAC